LRILTLSDRVMKKTILTLSTLFTIAICASAQQMVIPNKPFDMLNSLPGYITTNEFNFGIGLSLQELPFDGSFAGITTTHSYQVNQHFMAGGGTGVLFYNGGTLLPLYLDFRYNIVVKKVTPYVFADGGLLFCLGTYGGASPDNPLDNPSLQGTRIYINPGAGVRYAFNRKLAATAGAGVWTQMHLGRESFVNLRIGLVYKPY
jgi:hypothetical protein